MVFEHDWPRAVAVADRLARQFPLDREVVRLPFVQVTVVVQQERRGVQAAVDLVCEGVLPLAEVLVAPPHAGQPVVQSP